MKLRIVGVTEEVAIWTQHEGRDEAGGSCGESYATVWAVDELGRLLSHVVGSKLWKVVELPAAPGAPPAGDEGTTFQPVELEATRDRAQLAGELATAALEKLATMPGGPGAWWEVKT